MVAIEGLRGVDELIECRPDYREGRPHIAGTGVSVGRVGVLYTVDGLTAEQIAEEKSLTLEQAYAALAYYLRNRELIDADLKVRDALYDELADRYGRRSRHSA